ncbi:MAG: ATP-binding protein, partial [Saprospiraceae bacterium]|nr:ATP-binding protein [Saprospiraceae bacterium]
MKSPFKFLDYFTLADHDCFFGREEETRQLFDMVNKNRLVLVYGQSGTGKTSLVHCGLASQFNATDWMPVFIRRESNINDSLQAALAKALRLDRAEGDLLQTVQSVYTRYLRPVYLIFDQFEELFILGDAHEQQAFIRQMAELYESETSCQMLFIIREEFLASLYEFEKTVPTLFDRRLRVEPMSDKKVQTVLRESFKQFHITLENPERNIRQIIDKVSGEKSIIQLPYLQVYLDQFWQDDFDRTYTQPGIEPPADLPYPPLVFETQEIEAFGAIGDVLAKYLDQQKNNLQQLLDAQYNQLKGNEVARILDVFVTAKGTKRPVTMIRKGKMIELQGIPTGILDDLPPQLIADGLGMLEDSRILRINGANIELAHDKLAELIEHYRTDEDRKLESDRQLIEAAYDTHLRTGEYMSRKALLLVEDSLQKLKLPETQLQFIEAATADALMREDSERAEAINRAQEAEERIILAETARKNAKRFSYAIAVILLITCSFVFKIFQINAENNAKKIERLSREKQLLLEKAKAEDEFKKYYYGVLLFNEIDQNLESMQYEEAYALLLKVFHPKVRRDTIRGTVIA